MLVLSRRLNEKIQLPTLGVTVEVRGITRNAVRLGIDAPPSIAVVRDEIAPAIANVQASRLNTTNHQLRNRFHAASLAAHLAQKQLRCGMTKEAEATLDEALREFNSLDQELATAKASPLQTRKAIRTLLVEDDCNESALLAGFLRLNGFNVATASDGRDALDYLQSHDRPDVVLLDMRMPRCDGPTTIAAIRGNANYAGLKVFAVSGSDPNDCSLPLGPRGVDRWFTKPLNPVRLVDEMNLALARN
jgi:carbon storage regulator CsrA